MAKREATELGPPDWRVGGLRSEWVPGTDPHRTEPMSPAEVVEVILGFIGVAVVIVAMVLMFSQLDAPRREWVHGHYEGTTWVDGHWEGDKPPVD